MLLFVVLVFSFLVCCVWFFFPKQLLGILPNLDLGRLFSLSCFIKSVFVESCADFFVKSCVYLVSFTHADLEEKLCWKISKECSSY